MIHTVQIANRAHRCDKCRKPIKPGAYYTRTAHKARTPSGAYRFVHRKWHFGGCPSVWSWIKRAFGF